MTLDLRPLTPKDVMTMLHLLKNTSLFHQIAVPMFIVALLGMSAIFYSGYNLKTSIDDTKKFYDVSNYHFNKLNDIDKNFSSFQTLGLKHLVSESSLKMNDLSIKLDNEKQTFVNNIELLYQSFIAGNKNEASRAKTHLLKELTGEYFTAVSAALTESEEFEKEVAFEIWTKVEKKYVSGIDNTIQALIKEEFKHLTSGQDSIILAVNNNLMLTISLGMSGALLLFVIAFYVARRFSHRLMNLLIWSEKFSDDTASTMLNDNSDDEVGRLTRAINLMSKKITKSYEQLESAKELAEDANRTKSEFLANMSHELRTPMHAMLSFSAMGERKFDSTTPEKLKRYFSNINMSGQRLLILLNDLLDLSKLEASCMEYNIDEHDFGMIIDIAVTEFEELVKKNKLNLKIEYPANDIKGHFDAEKILQVVRNLLSNAIRYTPEGKDIIISYEQAEFSHEENITAAVSALTFSISDNGIGIPENETESVFDKFVQSSKTRTESGGTGLGLAICKEIIEGHHGTIKAENNSEGGAVFSFVIPKERTEHQALEIF